VWVSISTPAPITRANTTVSPSKLPRASLARAVLVDVDASIEGDLR
jgi:hypothetical protein